MLTMAQVSERTGIPIGTLRAMRFNNKGPRSYVLEGRERRVIYDEADVMAWVEHSRATTARGGIGAELRERTGATVEDLAARARDLSPVERDRLATLLRGSGVA